MKKLFNKILLRFGYIPISEFDSKMERFCNHVRLMDRANGCDKVWTAGYMVKTFKDADI